MNNYTPEFREFLQWEAISRDHIDVKTIYIDMAGGDHAAGIFLSQLVYWYLLPGKDGRSKLRVRRNGEYWIAKGRGDWYEEIRLKARQFDRVAVILRDLGVIETKTMRFAGVPMMHTRIVVDKFLEVWQQYADTPNLLELPRGVKSTSPDREVHIQRLQEEDTKDLPSGKSKEIIVAEEDATRDDDDTYCTVCKRKDKFAKRLDGTDKRGRCAWCLILDGWEYHIGAARQRLKLPPRVPQRSGTSTSEKLRKKALTRMNEEEFKNAWVFALERSGKMKHLITGGWFTLTFFLRNSESVEKIIGGTYDGFEQKDHKASYIALQQWLAWRAAGKAGEPQQATAGWSQLGG